MKLKVLDENYNPLLRRKEMKLEVDHDPGGTPKREDARREIAAHLGQDLQKVHIIKMVTLTGTKRMICEVELYEDPEEGKRIVHKHIQERGLPKAEKEKAEAPPKAKPPEEKGVEKKQAEGEERPEPGGEKQ